MATKNELTVSHEHSGYRHRYHLPNNIPTPKFHASNKALTQNSNQVFQYPRAVVHLIG